MNSVTAIETLLRMVLHLLTRAMIALQVKIHLISACSCQSLPQM